MGCCAGHPLIRPLTPVDPDVTAHSIIAARGDGPITGKTDDVVASESAHMDVSHPRLLFAPHIRGKGIL